MNGKHLEVFCRTYGKRPYASVEHLHLSLKLNELELQSMANNIGNYMDEFKSGMKQVKTNITQQLPIIMK